MRRIAIVDMGAAWGGQEQYSLALTEHLRARGFHVTSLSPHERHGTASDCHIPIAIDYSQFHSLRNVVASATAAADVVHFNGIRAIYFSALMRKESAAFVGAKHALRMSNSHDSRLKDLLARLAGWGAYRNLDRIISISKAIECELPRRAQRRSRVILNGVPDHGTQHPMLPDGSPLRVSYVGRLVEAKGIMRLLEAFVLLKQRGVAAHLLAAGNGPLEGAIREHISHNKLSEMVTFMGYQSDPGAVFADSQVCVLPSEYEGVPLSLLEAMSCSCAIVGHDVPGVRLVLEDGSNGLSSGMAPEAIAETLARLDADRPLLARLRRQARNDFERRWRIERMVDDTVGLYEEAIAARTGGIA